MSILPFASVPLDRLPHALGIVSFSGVPALVPASDIDAVRAFLASGYPVSSMDWAEGRAVRVISGSLEGRRGILQRVKDRYYVVVNLDLFGKGVGVQLDRAAVEVI